MKVTAKALAWISFTVCCSLASTTLAGCLDAARLTGVNLAGAEFNSKKLPGTVNIDYTYPNTADLTFMAGQGVNVIRLPFRWERVQHTLKAPLNADELGRLRSTVVTANEQGLCVILDVHNYAKYFGEELTGREDLQDGLIDLWTRLAAEFPDQTGVAFGLMNEPAYMTIAEWSSLSKRILARLRELGSRNLILIGGGKWSGMHSWFSESGGVSNANAFADVTDPLSRTYLEVHQYADEGYSGTKPECLPPEHFAERFSRITQWAKDNQQSLFLGEFGVAQNDVCLQTLESFLVAMSDPVWKGWTYWAAGRWWGSYAFALNTSMENPSRQWPILKKYFQTSMPAPDSPPKPPATQNNLNTR